MVTGRHHNIFRRRIVRRRYILYANSRIQKLHFIPQIISVQAIRPGLDAFSPCAYSQDELLGFQVDTEEAVSPGRAEPKFLDLLFLPFFAQ